MSTVTDLVVETIATKRELAAMEPDWLALEQSTGNTLPFRTFAWTEAWWSHMRQQRLALRDELSIRAVRDRAGRLVAVAPMVLTERPGFGPLRARSLCFVGADPNMTEVRGMLCDPSFEAASYRALRRDLERELEDCVDWVQWTGIDERGGGGEALGDAPSSWGSGVVSCELDLPGSWEEFRSSRPRNLKESLRKGYNSLARCSLPWRLEVIADAEGLEPALQDLFRLHAARAALRDTTLHGDVFRHPASRAFLVDVCGRFARAGALRVFRLHVDGRLAATRIGFVLGGCLYLYYSGFDPELAEYGVMTTTVAEALKYGIGEGLRRANLSTGLDVSKTRWRPRQVTFRDALIISPRASSHMKFELQKAARAWLFGTGPGVAPARLASMRWAAALTRRMPT